MAAVARSLRPFASRTLSQNLPLAPRVPAVSPIAGFPRGSVRCFSQSPLGMIPRIESSQALEDLELPNGMNVY